VSRFLGNSEESQFFIVFISKSFFMRSEKFKFIITVYATTYVWVTISFCIAISRSNSSLNVIGYWTLCTSKPLVLRLRTSLRLLWKQFIYVKVFIYQLIHIKVVLKYIKIYSKTTPTCFGAITIIRERNIWAC
jgi:hypothetical protein